MASKDPAGRRGDDAEPAPVDESAGLNVADAPKLELERLLGELSGHAQRVLAAQSRLRKLLRANAAVASDLSLQVVLWRIVEASRELVGAASRCY